MLPELQAEQQYLSIEAASVPHMTDAARQKIIRSWHRRAQGPQQRQQRPTTPEEIRLALAASGITVVEVPRRGETG